MNEDYDTVLTSINTVGTNNLTMEFVKSHLFDAELKIKDRTEYQEKVQNDTSFKASYRQQTHKFIKQRCDDNINRRINIHHEVQIHQPDENVQQIMRTISFKQNQSANDAKFKDENNSKGLEEPNNSSNLLHSQIATINIMLKGTNH